MSNYKTAIYTANEDLTSAIPHLVTPENTSGTQVVSLTFTASSPTARVVINFDAAGVHKTADSALIAALFVDDEQYARRVGTGNPPGAGYLVPVRLVYDFVPGDCEPHVYRIRVGAISGVCRLNGYSAGVLFGGTMASVLSVEEK